MTTIEEELRHAYDGLTATQARCTSLLTEARTARRELEEERQLFAKEVARLKLRIEVLEAELSAARRT